MGGYYTIELDRNIIRSTHVDLEGYGREVGALAECERLAKAQS